MLSRCFCREAKKLSRVPSSAKKFSNFFSPISDRQDILEKSQRQHLATETKKRHQLSTQLKVHKIEEGIREGKGRRCCLGNGIDSIPCHTTGLAPG